MSISFSGTFSRSAGIIDAIAKQIKQINLKPVKRIQVQFDPFHPNAVTARDFLFYISAPKVTETNLSCIIKTNVVCDRSEPQILVTLQKAGTIKFLANNLSALDILKQFNKHITVLVPKEEPKSVAITKTEKKKQKKK